MNNDQFRKLVFSNSNKSTNSDDGASKAASTPGRTGLGSRQRASIPMTPRALGGAQVDFARQLAERNQAAHPQKKFKTSAPKGAKLGSGYVDRARERQDGSEDDRVERLKALEESFKKEEIDQATFDKLRSEIAGGDLESTHLVKGLDFKLLERIRRGEDVTKASDKADDEVEPETTEDVDDEFDQLEQKEVEAITRDTEETKVKKKGQLSTVSLAPGKKRTRDQILADMKAARAAAAEKAQQESALGNRFRKINVQNKPGSRIERDSKGREVLIIVDEDGHEKRKVRKVQPGDAAHESSKDDLLEVDKSAKPLGMEVPEQFRKQEEPEEDLNDNIFSDAGDDYDPLAGMDADSDSDEEAADGDTNAKPQGDGDAEPGEISGEANGESATAPPPKPAAAAPRNYFKDSKTGLISEEASKAPSMSDPAIMAAIKRAAALNPMGRERTDEEDDDMDDKERKAKEERRKKMLSTVDRDDEDMDMGFGTSRFEDEEDFDESRVKLSTWGDEDGEDGGRGGGKGKRKRGPKKRKGDANSAADVLRVMEQRKRPEGS